METITRLGTFAEDVISGLTAPEKFLSSKYFYDKHGSKIFQQIMDMPEYYLTNCELEVFQMHSKEILESFRANHSRFELIELGAGDGLKTRVLLRYFLNENTDFTFMPIDISKTAIDDLTTTMIQELPTLDIVARVGDYFHLMEELKQTDQIPKIIMFLGSNIGNFDQIKSIDFLTRLNNVMNPGDKLFIGFDLKKDPDVILNAYNDPHGITASFNLNLLRRINDELDADFELLKFKHKEVYDPGSGTAKSYLVSKTDQTVYLGIADKYIHFEQWEPIFMEMSQKYDEAMIQVLAENSGFEVVRNFTDSRHYFMNSLWIK